MVIPRKHDWLDCSEYSDHFHHVRQIKCQKSKLVLPQRRVGRIDIRQHCVGSSSSSGSWELGRVAAVSASNRLGAATYHRSKSEEQEDATHKVSHRSVRLFFEVVAGFRSRQQCNFDFHSTALQASRYQL